MKKFFVFQKICFKVKVSKTFKVSSDCHIKAYQFRKRRTILTLFRMDLFGAAHGWGGAKIPPLPKICHTYPTMMKLSTVMPYLRKTQKIYDSRDTPLDLC